MLHVRNANRAWAMMTYTQHILPCAKDGLSYVLNILIISIQIAQGLVSDNHVRGILLLTSDPCGHDHTCTVATS